LTGNQTQDSIPLVTLNGDVKVRDFDTPKTKAMKTFLEREGPNGTGRVIGLSIEGEDGVFIYTESAKWDDGNGAGTFRGDNETQAISWFKQNVQRNDQGRC
jgi:hypothetical protein